MRIESLGKDVEMLSLNHKMAREVNDELLKDVVVTDGESTSIPALNATRSEELKVKLMFGLSQSELDSITEDEFIALKTEITKKK